MRPAEPAFPHSGKPPWQGQMPAGVSDDRRGVLQEAAKIRMESDKSSAALRDWVDKGTASRYALTPTEILERSGQRGRAEAEAAARFELGHHLWQTGREQMAVRHWREAHRLQPDNWTYKRQAWRLAHPEQGPTDIYDSDWLTDARKIGAENYYPPLRM